MKNRKLSTIVMICLVAVVCGLGGYIVYANINVTLTASNRIIFNTGDNVYYTASLKVYYEGQEANPLATDSINHNGNLSEQDLSKTSMELGEVFDLTSANRTIIYELTITNYNDKTLQVKLNKPSDKTGYYTNTVAPITLATDVGQYNTESSLVTLNKVVSSDDTTKAVTFKLTTQLTSAEKSFFFDNSFSVDLNIAN